MKKLLFLMLVICLGGVALADDDGEHGNNNNQCNVGPQGPTGQNGENGTNGANGRDGKDGKDGGNGQNASNGWNGTALVGDFAVRLYDGKRIQVQAFDVYQFGSHPGDDVFGQGRNQMIGARVVFKLGSSYEEREIAKLHEEIKALRRK